MEKITNYNCDRKCMEKFCDNDYTNFETIEIAGMEVIICFCDKHKEEFEKYVQG